MNGVSTDSADLYESRHKGYHDKELSVMSPAEELLTVCLPDWTRYRQRRVTITDRVNLFSLFLLLKYHGSSMIKCSIF